MEVASKLVTLRCQFCLTLNRVDLGKADKHPQCGDCARPLLLDRPVKVAQEDFEATVLKSDVPVLADFYADWCGPCKLIAPLMDEIAAEQRGRVLVVKIDTDRAPELSQQLSIRGVPTIILFKDGEEAGRSVGFEPDVIQKLVSDAG